MHQVETCFSSDLVDTGNLSAVALRFHPRDKYICRGDIDIAGHFGVRQSKLNKRNIFSLSLALDETYEHCMFAHLLGLSYLVDTSIGID